jgi:hypothetical protein
VLELRPKSGELREPFRVIDPLRLARQGIACQLLERGPPLQRPLLQLGDQGVVQVADQDLSHEVMLARNASMIHDTLRGFRPAGATPACGAGVLPGGQRKTFENALFGQSPIRPVYVHEQRHPDGPHGQWLSCRADGMRLNCCRDHRRNKDRAESSAGRNTPAADWHIHRTS